MKNDILFCRLLLQCKNLSDVEVKKDQKSYAVSTNVFYVFILHTGLICNEEICSSLSKKEMMQVFVSGDRVVNSLHQRKLQ